MSGGYNRKDHVYKKAQAEGRRSRAYYKLADLQDKFRIIKTGDRVLDLGAWPGGWLEYAASLTGGSGKVVGIDLKEIDPFPNPVITTITGDVRDDEARDAAREIAGGSFDVVLSDMSPKLTGIKTVDRTAAIGLAELAFWVCEQMGRPGANFVIKVFKGNETEEFVKIVRPRFNRLVREEVKSTRKTSTEFYIVGLGLL